MSSVDRDADDGKLGEIVDEVLSKMARGESVDLEKCYREHPDVADVLRHAIPALRTVTPPDSGACHDSSLLRSQMGATGGSVSAHQLGDSRIVKELGRGGMGIVYEAEQISMARNVALKVLPFAGMVRGNALQRFHNEVRAAAALSHPNIVPVYSVGEERGVHYYAMKLIRGQSLAAVIEQLATLQRGDALTGDAANEVLSSPDAEIPSGRSQPTRHLPSGRAGQGGQPTKVVEKSATSTIKETGHDRQFYRSIATIAAQAADALEHAHQNGVIHRDIKPGNLMLDAESQLYVTDFGLARIETDAAMTRTGELLGTLRYMSPEQATSKSSAIDHRCDVYSLGATLYELLAFRPAFVGEDRQELLSKILRDDPVAPSKWNRRIPADLDTIVMKSMEKEPSARYENAQAMANDLRCYLDDRPISARRSSSVVRIRKWGRRHPAIVRSSTAMLAVVAVAWLIGSVLIFRQKSKTEIALSQANENLLQSELNRAKAEDAIDRLNALAYVRGLGLAAKAWQEGDAVGAAALMRSSPAYELQPECRGFEWHYLDSLLSTPDNVVVRSDVELSALAVSRDGKLIAIGDAAGSIRLMRQSGESIFLEGHHGPIHSLDLDARDERLASGCEDGTIRIWDMTSGREISVIHTGHEGRPVMAVRYSHDGKLLASGGGDGKVRLWDPITAKQHFMLSGHTREVRAVEFSPDDKTIVSGSNDRDLRVWCVATRESIRTLRGHAGMVLCLAFTADGRNLISGSNDHTIRCWNHATGEEVCVIREHHDGVQAIAVLADGGIVAGDRGGNLRIWRIRGKKPVDRFRSEGFSSFLSAQLSPDGKSWAGLTEDGRLILRDMASHRTRVLLSGIAVTFPRAAREQLAFSPDGAKLFCVDRIVTLPSKWDDELDLPLKLEMPVAAPGHFTPDGKQIAVGTDGSIQLFDPETGQRLREFASPMEAIVGLRSSHDGNHLLGWAPQGPIVRWDWQSGSVVESIDHPVDQIVDLKLSPDGNKIATCGRTGEVNVRDERTSRWRELDLGGRHCSSVSWYDQGTTLALSAPGLQDFLYRLAPDALIESVADNRGAEQTQVSRRHRLFISNIRGVGVDVLDLGQLEVTPDVHGLLQGHTDRIWALSVTANGEGMITASRDGTLRRWSRPLSRWQWLSRRRHVDDRVDDFAWSADQKMLGIAEIGRGQIFQWQDGRLQHQYRWWGNSGVDSMGFAFESIAMPPTGSQLATGHRDGSIRFWNQSPGPPVHVLQAMDVDSDVSAINISPDGRFLAACSRRGNVVHVFRTGTWQPVYSGSADDCDDLLFSTDGRWLAYCDGRDAVLVSVDSFHEIKRFSDHSLTVNALAFSPDDRMLVTACEDRKLRFWDTESGVLTRDLRGHTASIKRVTFSPDGAIVVSGDAGGVIKLWHLPTGEELFTLADLDSGIDKLSFDASGRVLVVLTSDGLVHVFDSGSRY